MKKQAQKSQETSIQQKIDSLENKKSTLNCTTQELLCLKLDISINELKREKTFDETKLLLELDQYINFYLHFQL